MRRLLVLTVLLIQLWGPGIVAQSDSSTAAESPVELQQAEPSTADINADDCSSLTGPFCAHTGSMAFYASYMMPIAVLDLQQEGKEVSRRSTKTDDGVTTWRRKKCFFQHFTNSWMDSGGDANDLMNQQVSSVDECEQLCCEHAECQCFTFWRGRTCFLRATSKTLRLNGDSFSGIRLA